MNCITVLNLRFHIKYSFSPFITDKKANLTSLNMASSRKKIENLLQSWGNYDLAKLLVITK